jgi:hypothetical protein
MGLSGTWFQQICSDVLQENATSCHEIPHVPVLTEPFVCELPNKNQIDATFQIQSVQDIAVLLMMA